MHDISGKANDIALIQYGLNHAIQPRRSLLLFELLTESDNLPRSLIAPQTEHSRTCGALRHRIIFLLSDGYQHSHHRRQRRMCFVDRSEIVICVPILSGVLRRRLKKAQIHQSQLFVWVDGGIQRLERLYRHTICHQIFQFRTSDTAHFQRHIDGAKLVIFDFVVIPKDEFFVTRRVGFTELDFTKSASRHVPISEVVIKERIIRIVNMQRIRYKLLVKFLPNKSDSASQK
mmetsp:Transcript_32844/g.52584  ORF Transcript_32844/g.52584 Transcript_32844/m.52584 type:complete len:231 (-) Transcript_32844:19-711(-)